jgi:hypothetical protein
MASQTCQLKERKNCKNYFQGMNSRCRVAIQHNNKKPRQSAQCHLALWQSFIVVSVVLLNAAIMPLC